MNPTHGTKEWLMGRSSALLTAAFAGLMLVSIQASAAPRGAQQIQVHNIDVGQGSATLIQTIGGKNILVDTGWDFAGKRLVAYMKKIGVKKLDAVVITHRHMDHIGGAQAVAEAFPVARVIGPWAKSGIPNSAMVHLAHMRKDLNEGKTAGNRPAYQAASTGKVFDFGNGFKLETLWPKVPSSGKRIGDYNEESVTMRVSQAIPGKRGVKPATFLVAGDLGVAEERWVARTMPGKLKVDWIVSNHHGSKGSSQREYMVATGDGYSRMLRALILGQGTRDQFVFKTARKFYDEVKGGRYAAAVLKNLDPLYKPRRPLIEGSRLDRMVKGIKQIQKWDADKGRPPRYAVYSTGPNAYGHPNATRMAEAVLAGFAPITTWANSASVVMTRKVGSDGKWDSGWTPSARSSRGLPRMKMPGWLGKTDEDKPYNNDRREANSHWQRLNPHPEVSWTANWDTSQTWRGLARKNAKGRKQWVEEYVALKKDATEGTRDGVKPRNASQKAANKRAAQRKLKSMQYSARKEWHGLNLRGMKELSREQLKVLVSGRGQKVSKGQGPRPTTPARRCATPSPTGRPPGAAPRAPAPAWAAAACKTSAPASAPASSAPDARPRG
jgi:beta-lactamase superfamily II metal-dependent hydrolase